MVATRNAARWAFEENGELLTESETQALYAELDTVRISADSLEVENLQLREQAGEMAERIMELQDERNKLNHAAQLAKFHEAFDQEFGHGDISDSALRIRLHCEETQELVEALKAGNLVGAARELADVVYVAYGTAHSLGIPLDAVFAEVHRANMSKFGPDRAPLLDEDGKVLKGPHFRPPNVRWALDSVYGCTCSPDEEDRSCGLHGSYEPY